MANRICSARNCRRTVVLSIFIFCLLVAWHASSVADDAYLQYVHPTIRQPFPDLVNLAVPPELEDQATAALGLVDVTKAPFKADPTGKTDSTAALQAAIRFARDHQMVCFFPPGTYLASDTLECVQQLYQRTNGRIFGGNRFPNLLVGSRAGAKRPTIVLAPNSPGFDDPAQPKIFVRFWSRGYGNPTTADRVSDGLSSEVEQPNIGMNQMLVNLDIVIGRGNAGAVAVRHQAAEGSAIEDCTIDATHGHTGIQGAIGSGGGSAGVTVLGGRIGLDFTGYMSGSQPTPTITGFTLQGQTEAAVRSSSRQTLVAAGLKIIADRCVGPLIQVVGGRQAATGRPGASSPRLRANHGELILVDGEIEFTGDAARRPERIVIQSDRGVYLEDVYVRGATTLVLDPAQPARLDGAPDGWLHVHRHAYPAEPRSDQGFQYRYPVYVDGRPVPRVVEVQAGETPPADLQTRHLWRADFPGFESPGAVNVKAPPYGARGDGRTDDTGAIQRAIDENEIVFLPKGCYRLTRTLELRPHTKLIGTGQHLSLLVVTGEAPFASDEAPPVLVRTADSADASTILAFLGLYSPHGAPDVQALHWRCGGSSVFRAVEIHTRIMHGAHVLISGNGGGNWYNFRASLWPRGPKAVPDYRHLLVDGARGPLRFYQFSPQHATSDFAAEFRESRYISVFGAKYEGNQPMLAVRDCDHVRLFGHGGNAKALPGEALYLVERTPNFLLANAVDGPTPVGSRSLSHPLGSTDPREWHMLIDRPAAGPEVALPPLDRPVLYLRGRPEEGG
ncbi:MAG: glycosyl hydrolase family 28-related protein [Patescibacteria group bacterium]|nr:glycosyl hydrolase family 28-related protein [Patescibacteria group bacterium]